MENLVYERDYADEHRKRREREGIAVLERVISGGFLKNLEDSYKALPKMIVPEYKANYEHLLDACDNIAKQLGGHIRGVVDYERWEAFVDVVLPYAEFASEEELQLLKEISEKVYSATFRATEDGNTNLRLYIPYFEDLVSDEEKEYLKYEELIKDPELLKQLGGLPDTSPKLDAFIVFMDGLLGSVEQATQQDRTEIFIEIINRVNDRVEDDDMGNIVERLEEIAQEMIEESN